MQQTFESQNNSDVDGNPAGGYVVGTGLTIRWQEGPLGRDADRIEPNGAFVETVIAATRQRIAYYQEASDGRFACDENAEALKHLDAALAILNERTAKREARGVEGTHEA